MLKELIGPLLLASFVIVLLASVTEHTSNEQMRWAVFKLQHDCKITVRGAEYEPTRTPWKCNDGKVYWR